MSELKMELIKINEAIDMIQMTLDIHEDMELVERLEKLIIERNALIEQMHTLN